jgi:hypothetical protein
MEWVWNLVNIFILMNFKIKTSHDKVTIDDVGICNRIY